MTSRQTSNPIAPRAFPPTLTVNSSCKLVSRLRLTKAVNSCGLEMSFGAIVPFDGPACLIAIGVLSLSPSVDFEGVAGTFNG